MTPSIVGTMLIGAAVEGVGLAYVFEDMVSRLLSEKRLVRVLDGYCPRIPGYFLYYPSRLAAAQTLAQAEVWHFPKDTKSAPLRDTKPNAVDGCERYEDFNARWDYVVLARANDFVLKRVRGAPGSPQRSFVPHHYCEGGLADMVAQSNSAEATALPAPGPPVSTWPSPPNRPILGTLKLARQRSKSGALPARDLSICQNGACCINLR